MADSKELVIISGKGGTGKTSLAACLASLFNDRVVADCDVDAANLDLLLRGTVLEKKEFVGGSKAVIDLGRCIGCGTCRDVCRFSAISEGFLVDRVACEGCGACAHFCPTGAVDFSPRLCGECYICRDGRGHPFVFAELLPGEENSGKLVTMVRTEARDQADRRKLPLIIIDGPPGIGCPVISSVTGTHYALVVTEPTGSGIHDMERVVELTSHFGIGTGVVINKSDIHQEYMEQIRARCEKGNLTFLGDIPFEPRISEAQRAGQTILGFAPDSLASAAVKGIFEKLQNELEGV